MYGSTIQQEYIDYYVCNSTIMIITNNDSSQTRLHNRLSYTLFLNNLLRELENQYFNVSRGKVNPKDDILSALKAAVSDPMKPTKDVHPGDTLMVAEDYNLPPSTLMTTITLQQSPPVNASEKCARVSERVVVLGESGVSMSDLNETGSESFSQLSNSTSIPNNINNNLDRNKTNSNVQPFLERIQDFPPFDFLL